jgi:hypothetical protein
VRDDVCDVCLADLGESHGRQSTSTAPEAAGDELRFSDVVAEIREVVALASGAGDRWAVSAAGQRAESLLVSLRAQFLGDLGIVPASVPAPGDSLGGDRW